MRNPTIPLLCASILALTACTDQSVVGPQLSPTVRNARVTTPGTGPWARVVEGETGPGSLYALYVPQKWNGEAIYYAHGIRAPEPFAGITLDDQDNFYEVREPTSFVVC
jgi:hypothetical protein